MHTSRRTFLKETAWTLAGTMVFSKDVFALNKGKQILGIQLYSVRDDMKTDPTGTLKQLATMGYKYVEHANYVNRKFYGYSATEFKKILDDLGLKMPSGHTVMGKQHWNEGSNSFTDQWKFTVEDAAKVGQKYVISPSLDESQRKTYDEVKRYMDVFNKSGELCKKWRMKFGYHNHDYEFEQENGKVLYDVLVENTDPSLVHLELDLGWVIVTGHDPIDYFNKYPGRFPLWHLKDMDIAKKHSVEFGLGGLDIKKMLNNESKAGMKYFFVEQEEYTSNPAESMKISMDYLKRLKL